MKTNILKTTILVATFIIGIAIPVQAQTFTYTIENDVQTAENVLEFDLYLHNKDAKRPIEVAGIQAGITVNPKLINGGTITVSIVPGSCELVTDQEPTAIVFASNCIKIATKKGPGTGNATIMSTATQGTKYCRIRITNSVAFAEVKPDLRFSFNTVPYPTKIHEYVEGISTPMKIDTTNCYSMARNATILSTSALKAASKTIIEIKTIKNKAYITGLNDAANVSVIDVAGKEVQHFTGVVNNQALLLRNSGIYIIKVTTATQAQEVKAFVSE